MDLIALHQSGIKNVVAVSGTALTEEQVQLISRYTKNVVLLFDADTAGIKASMRSIELLLKRDIEVKIASLPSGEDPDSFVNNYGKEKFEEVIKKAENFLEYQTGYFSSQGMFDDPAKTAEAIRELVKPVAIISDEIKRSLLIKSIAKNFDLREKLLETELQKAFNVQGKQITGEERIRDREIAQSKIVIEEKSSKKVSPKIYNLEREIIKLLFEGNGEIVEFISYHISPEEFAVNAHLKLAALIYDAFRNNESIIAGSLIGKITDEDLQTYVQELTFEKYAISKNWEEIYPGLPHDQIMQKVARDTVKKFKVEEIDFKIKNNLKLIEEVQNEEERVNIMKLNRDLETEKTSIAKDLDGNYFN